MKKKKNRRKRVAKTDYYLIDKWKQEGTTGLNIVRVRKSIWGGHIWMQGPKSSQVTPTALTVFTIFAFLVPLSLPPFISIFIFRLSFLFLFPSPSISLSFFPLFLLKLARTHSHLSRSNFSTIFLFPTHRLAFLVIRMHSEITFSLSRHIQK